jgi:hypothetical protein
MGRIGAHPLGSLTIRLLGALGVTVGLCLLAWVAGYHLRPVLPFSVCLVVALISWLVTADLDIAFGVDRPRLDTDPDAASPHAGDVRVRRLEDMMHAAQPRRRMTGRALGQVLGEIADERAHHPAAPPLPQDLRRLIEISRDPDTDPRHTPSVDRRTLHRYLRALADLGPTATDPGRPTPTQEDPS